MCATRTGDVAATLKQIASLAEHGAGLVRIAVDSRRDLEALKAIRQKTNVPLAVDLQENYQLAAQVAPYVQKIRYNPGHLFHHDREKTAFQKVHLIVEAARRHACAVRIGINCGSLAGQSSDERGNTVENALALARQHVQIMEDSAFKNYVVSLKSARPEEVVEANRRFASEFEQIPLHLGVTEAGMLPEGEAKSRAALENLLAEGIGDTIRVSLTLPAERKFEEVLIARRIVEDVYAGRLGQGPAWHGSGLNIISCPSCARVENEKFVELAGRVREVCRFAEHENVTIAVMGCRVNGPGESDQADLGLWCAVNHVNLKRGTKLIGAFSYEDVLERLKAELVDLIASRKRG